MYARGDIDSAAYHRLLEMARSGELTWDDLRELSARGAAAATQTAAVTPKDRDADIVRSLNKLYAHRSAIEQSRKENEAILARLEADADRLREQAELARQKADAVADQDEASARAYLAVRQDALERVAVLDERITALRQDLARLADLESELSTKEAELKALESQSKLAELEASIREDLLLK
jgi:phage shock protein A